MSDERQIYGHLEVLGEFRIPRPGRETRTVWMYQARCLLCGSVRDYQANNLRTGHTVTCGCAKKLREILPGERFGSLVVVSRESTSEYTCICDCGKTVTGLSPTKLIGEHTKSCGCRKTGKAVARELAGARFGQLIVESRTDQKAGVAYLYKCLCDCGNYVYSTSSKLKAGKIKSCGCIPAGNTEKILESRKKMRVDNTCLDQIPIGGKPNKHGTSGIRGVSWASDKNKWLAHLRVQGKYLRLGYFDNIEDAARARREGEETYFRPILEKHGMIPERDDNDLRGNRKKP